MLTEEQVAEIMLWAGFRHCNADSPVPHWEKQNEETRRWYYSSKVLKQDPNIFQKWVLPKVNAIYIATVLDGYTVTVCLYAIEGHAVQPTLNEACWSAALDLVRKVKK